MPCHVRGRDWSDTPVSQGLRATPEARRGKEASHLSQGAWPCRYLDLGLPAPRLGRSGFLLFQATRPGLFLQPEETNRLQEDRRAYPASGLFASCVGHHPLRQRTNSTVLSLTTRTPLLRVGFPARPRMKRQLALPPPHAPLSALPTAVVPSWPASPSDVCRIRASDLFSAASPPWSWV